MRHRLTGIAMASAVLALLAGPAGAAAPPGGLITTCPPDAVVSGTTCMDKYEASVWRVPNPTTTNKALVAKIQQGEATAALLTAGGATLLGQGVDDSEPCAASGQHCANDIYAVSLPGVTPSTLITWFQAQEACANAGKRLPSNAEWQAAAAGTPDPGPDNGTTDCNTGSVFATVATGSRRNCVSSRGAFDMVGNVNEWVADWVPRTPVCVDMTGPVGTWSDRVSPTGDLQCLVGAAESGEPGALVRGGGWSDHADAGPLFIVASVGPSHVSNDVGFRCVGPAIVTVEGSDLVEGAVTTNPPAPVRTPGTTFSVADTVQNLGPAPAGPSSTRYYLSLDPVKSASDVLLTPARAVPALAVGAVHSGTVAVTIPAATPPNSYFLLACADDLGAVSETDNTNNCSASATAIVTVARPDLVETTVAANPPAPVRAPGTTFSVTDTVQNLGLVPSAPSTTRYYLSLDAAKSADDILLTGSRAVPGLAAAASHSGTVTVTIPSATPLSTYFLLACADDLNTVAEPVDADNCIATPTASVTVTRADLAESTVSDPPATKARATSFPITDTVQNIGGLASGPSTTRYYLSLDGVKTAADLLMTGSRPVPALAVGGSQSGTATVTIPASTPPNTYFVLACADNTNTVVETDENNNCTPSSTRVAVTP